MPAIVATAVLAGLAGGVGFSLAAGLTFAGFSISSFATSLVLGGLSSALKKSAPEQSPSLAYDAAGRTQSVRQPITPWRVVYGTDRVGGAVTFMAPIYSNYIGTVITLTCHRARSVREIYFGDELVPLTFDSNGQGRPSGRYNGYAWVWISVGTDASDIPFPNSGFTHQTQGEWSANHKQAGHTKILVWFYRDRNVFPNGIPNVTVVMDGYDQVYDPRDTTYKWTNNPALCIADYLMNTRFGYSVPYANINEDELIAAANVCDERVSQIYQPAFTVTAASDLLTFASSQNQINTGDAVKYHTSSGAAGGLSNNALYYYIAVSATTGKLATTRDGALAGTVIDLTSAGSGTQTLERMPVVTADASTDVLTFEAEEKRLFTGDGVQVETSNTLPSGISAATTYYLIRHSASTTGTQKCQLATSYANALAGTAINITDAGTGVHRLKPMDEPRFTLNGSFSLDEKPQDILVKMTNAMAGRTVKIGSEWHILAGAYTAPSETLTETELDGPITVQVLPGRDQFANGIKGVFVGPENFYQPTDFIPATNATYLAADNSERVWKDIELPMVRRHSQARRLAKIELERIRQSMTVVLQCRISAYRVQPGNVVGLTISRYGWSNKAFEITNSKLVVRGEGDNIRLGVDHYLRETASGVFDWSATENDVVDIAPNTTLPDPFELAARVPLNVSGLEVFNQGNDVSFTGRHCKVAWRRSSGQSYFEFGGEPDAQGLGAGRLDDWFAGWVVRVYTTGGTLLREEPPSKDPSYIYTYEKNFEDTDGVPLRTFVIKVWGKTDLGKESAIPAQITPVNAAPTATAPTVSASVKGLKFTFAKPTDTDWFGFKVWGSTSNGFTADASTLLYSGVDTEFTIGNLTTGVTFYYKYAAVDSFGDGSTSSQLSVSPGVVALSVDLNSGAATAPSAVANSGSFSYPADSAHTAGNLGLAYLAITTDYTAPASPIVQFIGSLVFSADQSSGVLVESFDYTGTYSAGSIVSIAASGGNTRITGSGTSWLSSGIALGDRIALDKGNGVVWYFYVLSVDSNTQITAYEACGASASFSGSYIAYKGAVQKDSGSDIQSLLDLVASKTTQVNLVGIGRATSSSASVVGRVYFVMGATTHAGGGSGSASYRSLQVLQSRR